MQVLHTESDASYEEKKQKVQDRIAKIMMNNGIDQYNIKSNAKKVGDEASRINQILES